MNPRPWLGVNTSLVDVSGRMGTGSARPGGAAWLNPGGSTAPAPAAPMTASQSRRGSETPQPGLLAPQGERAQQERQRPGPASPALSFPHAARGPDSIP